MIEFNVYTSPQFLGLTILCHVLNFVYRYARALLCINVAMVSLNTYYCQTGNSGLSTGLKQSIHGAQYSPACIGYPIP